MRLASFVRPFRLREYLGDKNERLTDRVARQTGFDCRCGPGDGNVPSPRHAFGLLRGAGVFRSVFPVAGDLV